MAKVRLYRESWYCWGVTTSRHFEAEVEVDAETAKRWKKAEADFQQAQVEMQTAARDQAGNGRRYGR